MRPIRARYDAEGRKVTVEIPGEGDDTVGIDVTDPRELFDAGVQIIEAANWLSRVQFDQQRAKVEGLVHEARASGELKPGGKTG